jgi:hypothetical protein
LDHPAEAALPAMKLVLSRLDDAVILAGIQKVRLGLSRDGHVTTSMSFWGSVSTE